MTRVVLGERMWYWHKDETRPADVLNYLNGPISMYALYAALQRRPARTAVFTALTMVMKLLFVGHVARYCATRRKAFPEDVQYSIAGECFSDRYDEW